MIRSNIAALLVIGQLALQPFGVQVARADEAADLSQARAKFQRAIELKQAGDYAGALTLFREVGQFKMTPQVRYQIAGCEEGLGKLVTAYGGYELARAQGQDMPADFLAEVDAAIERLGARIPKLIITRGKGAEAAKIELDGVLLGSSSVGHDVPLDPGPHAVTATAPGYLDYSETVEAIESSTVTLEITMMPIPKATQPVAEPAKVETPPKGYGIAPYIVGGAGLGLALVGVILLPVSQASISEAEEICPEQDCTGASAGDQARVREILSSAQTTEAVGWSLIGVGAVAVGVGVTLYLVDPARKPRDSALRAGPFSVVMSAPRTQVGLSLSAAF